MNKYLTTIISVLAIMVIVVVAFMLIPRHPRPHATSGIAVSEWKYSGYDNPKSAIISAAAAIRKDNGQAFVDSLTPEMRRYFEFCWQPAMRKNNKTLAQLISARVSRPTADATIHIVKEKVLSDRWAQVVVKISAEGQSQTFSVALRNVDGEWKVDAFQ